MCAPFLNLNVRKPARGGQLRTDWEGRNPTPFGPASASGGVFSGDAQKADFVNQRHELKTGLHSQGETAPACGPILRQFNRGRLAPVMLVPARDCLALEFMTTAASCECLASCLQFDTPAVPSQGSTQKSTFRMVRERQRPARQMPGGLSYLHRLICNTHISYYQNKEDNYAAAQYSYTCLLQLFLNWIRPQTARSAGFFYFPLADAYCAQGLKSW
jgi:hypothetical protein